MPPALEISLLGVLVKGVDEVPVVSQDHMHIEYAIPRASRRGPAAGDSLTSIWACLVTWSFIFYGGNFGLGFTTPPLDLQYDCAE